MLVMNSSFKDLFFGFRKPTNGAIFTVIRTEFMKIMQNHDICMTCHDAKKKIGLQLLSCSKKICLDKKKSKSSNIQGVTDKFPKNHAKL